MASSFSKKNPISFSRTGFWLALAVFICRPAFTGGARKLISNRRSSKVTRSRITCQIKGMNNQGSFGLAFFITQSFF
jgi:hypothetical protein